MATSTCFSIEVSTWPGKRESWFESTPMLKHVDVATYNSFMDAKNGTWKPGIEALGLKEGGVDYALDEYNKNLITPEAKAKADQAKADIISGKIKVHDYMSDDKCPM